ncbi:cytochrome P450 [Lentzea aerocolonigenes]|uniref:cytochrome P450 n=1 Tax=Lentzea aerocolonigenes TaxID=68170 RepID=UPI0012E285CE|nr:cytochrome P450 [Lentzea aerocolonigenes]
MLLEEIFRAPEVGPVRFTSFGAWLVTRYSEVDRVLTDHSTFSSDELRHSTQPIPHRDNPLLRSLLATDPPQHQALRRKFGRLFTPRAVAALEPEIKARAEALITGSSLDLVREVAYPLTLHTIAGLLGVPVSPDFVRWTEAITSFFGTFAADDTDFRLAVRELRAFFQAQGMIDDELVNLCTLLLINGHETTKTLLVNAMLCLVSQPLPADLPLAIEEVLRYLPPTGGTDRFVTRPTTLGGVELRPGQRVIAMISAANRDPEVFADPDTFDAGRTVNPHLSFGHGIHFCPGAHLARLQVRIALSVLLEREWQIADLETRRTPVGIDVLELKLHA